MSLHTTLEVPFDNLPIPEITQIGGNADNESAHESGGSPETDSIDQLMAMCAEDHTRSSLFKDRSTVISGLAPAYRLLICMSDDYAAAGKVHARYSTFSDRQRQLTKGRIPLLAVYFTARPVDSHERRICGDYTYLLEHALDERVGVEEFVNWAHNVTFAQATSAVRKKRRGATKAAKAANSESRVVDKSKLVEATTSDAGITATTQTVHLRVITADADKRAFTVSLNVEAAIVAKVFADQTSDRERLIALAALLPASEGELL